MADAVDTKPPRDDPPSGEPRVAWLLLLLVGSPLMAAALGIGSGTFSLPGDLSRYNDLVFWTGTPLLLILTVRSIRADMVSIRQNRALLRQQIGERAQRQAKQLAAAIRGMTAISDELQREADEARRTVEKLRQDAETYEALAKVGSEEAQAVARLVRNEMQSEGRRSFRSGLTLNLAFFIAGVVVTVLLARLGLA